MRKSSGSLIKKSLLLVAAVSVVLTGCGKGNASVPTGQDNQDKGRYVEKTVTLPEGVNATDVEHLGHVDGNLYFYTKEDAEGKLRSIKYIYDSENNTWKEETPEWLGTIDVPYEEYGKFQVIEMKDNTAYLYYVYSEEEIHKGHLYGTTDGKTVKEITPEEWKVEDPEYHFYRYPEKITILSDGTVVAQLFSQLSIYNGTDGSLIRNIQLETEYSTEINSLDTQYILMKSSMSGSMTGLDVFDTKNDKPITEYPYIQKSTSFNYLDVAPDGSFVLCNADGIFTLSKENQKNAGNSAGAADGGNSLWTTVIQGSFTSLGLVSVYPKDIAAPGNEKYYILFDGEDGEGGIMEYVYDPELSVTVDKELKVYTIFDNFTLRQAAALFHKNNPDVLVTIESVVSKEDEYQGNYNLDDIHKNLNALLLSDNGPDILILDMLDIDAFAGKGLLVDLSDTLSPMEEKGEILTNITDAFKTEDGKLYTVPARFYISLIVGKEVNADEVSTLKGLAEKAAASSEPLMGKRTPEELVKELLPFFITDIVDGKVLNRDALKENLEYLKAIGDNGGIVDDYGDQMRGQNIWELPAYIQVAITKDEGFNQAMLPLSIAKLINGSYTAFENTFYPALQAGVNSKSKEIDVAKSFVGFLLSEEVQRSDFYDGYPVNLAALEKQKNNDRTNNQAYTSIEISEGMSQEFAIGTYEDVEADKLMNLCKSVNKATKADSKVEEEIIAAIPGYLKGTQSLEDTITKIEDGLRLYLAE